MKASTIRKLLTLGGAVALAAGLVHCDSQQGTPDPGSAPPDLAAPADMSLPAPTITGVSPSSGQNAAPTPIAITGAAFQDGATVTVGGQPCLSPAVTPTRITCTVPANQRICGAQPVVVKNPDRQSATSAAGFTDFTATFQAGAPKIGVIYPYVNANILVSGDLNGDGILDVATNDSSGNLSVLLGKGDGTFRAALEYATGATQAGLAAGDLNGDGTLDLVATSGTGKGYSVLLGKGDGTFWGAVNTSTTFSPVWVALGDLNGDGTPDLVMSGSNTYAVALGNGDGTFQAAAFTASNNQPRPLLADLDRDGRLDLVVTGSYNTCVNVALGNGDGTFGAQAAYGNAPCNVAVAADFNDDGKLDLAATHGFYSTVLVLLGNGDGTFQRVNPVGDPTSYSLQGLSAADLNGDGIQDLVVADTGSGYAGSFSYFQGKGDGTFAAPMSTAAYNSGQLLVADLNGDHLPDVTVLDGQDSEVLVFLQQCR